MSNTTKEIVLKTNITRKPSKTYFVQDNHLVERDRKTKQRKNLLGIRTEKGYFYFPEGYNLKTITIKRVKVKQGYLPIAA